MLKNMTATESPSSRREISTGIFIYKSRRSLATCQILKDTTPAAQSRPATVATPPYKIRSRQRRKPHFPAPGQNFIPTSPVT